MINFSSFPLTSTGSEQLLSPELAYRLESRLLPESGSRSEIKRALFEISDLCDALREHFHKLMLEQFKEQFHQMSQQMLFQPQKIEALPFIDMAERESSSAIAFRKIYYPSGASEVLWERGTGKYSIGRLVFDDS